MFSKSIILLSLAAATFASPAPQNENDLSSLAASFTSQLGSLTALDTGSLSSELAVATSLFGALSDLPVLPSSVQSVLMTAVPLSELTKTDYACQITAAEWYNDLPGDVKSALTSYGSALSTWAEDHISDLGSYTGVPICTGGATGNGAGGSGSSATTDASGSSQTTGGSTARGSAASSTNSPGAAPRATGAIVGSLAGIVGALGVMAVL